MLIVQYVNLIQSKSDFDFSCQKVVLDNTALNRIATERLKKTTPTFAELNQLVIKFLNISLFLN